MFTPYHSLLALGLAVLCSTVITFHSTPSDSIDDIYPGSLSHSLLALRRHRRSLQNPSESPPHRECADGCCGRTHVCGLRGCAFKARCGIDCCPPEVVQDLKLRAQRLTLAAAGVQQERPPPQRSFPNNNNQNNNQNNQHNNNLPPPPLRSYKKIDGDHHHNIIVHEKPPQRPQQQQRPKENQQQQGRNQQGPPPPKGHVDRNPERIRQPPSPPPMNPARPSEQPHPPPHPNVDHPHRQAGPGGPPMGGPGVMAPHPHTTQWTQWTGALTGSLDTTACRHAQLHYNSEVTGAFGPSSRGGFSAAVQERRAVENANAGMQSGPAGRMTFNSLKPQQNHRPPPGKSVGPKRPPAFTNRPPGGMPDTPLLRPKAFGVESMPFIHRVKRCCECCMPDCHHGCIRNGGCGQCQALTGNQNNNNSGITRGARTKQHN